MKKEILQELPGAICIAILWMLLLVVPQIIF